MAVRTWNVSWTKCGFIWRRDFEDFQEGRFPRQWLGEYITAIDVTDNISNPVRWKIVCSEGFEGFPDSPKISGFVEESEDDDRIPHLVLPGEWAERLTFIKIVASPKNKR